MEMGDRIRVTERGNGGAIGRWNGRERWNGNEGSEGV